MNIDLIKSPMNWIFVGFALLLLSFISQIFFTKVN